MDGCIYRTKDGECDLYAEGGKFTAFCEMDGCKGRKMSNADRIRAMTDEELGEFLLNRDLNDVEKASKAVGFTYKVDREQCLVNVIGWLREEAVFDG